MITLLVAECEILIVRHYEIRTALRAALHLPLYHILLAVLAFGVLVAYLAGGSLPGLPDAPINGRWLCLHLFFYLLVSNFLQPLFSLSSGEGGAGMFLLWSLVIAIFGATWLAAVLPPRLWLQTLLHTRSLLLMLFMAAGFTIWLSYAIDALWPPLAGASLYLTNQLLHLYFKETYVNAPQLEVGTPTFHIQILPGCSGYEGMGLMAMLTVAYLWLRRRELYMQRAWWLVPGGMLAIWLANSVRLALLVAIGTLVSPQIALRGFHSQAGWIAFSIISVGLVALAERLGWFRRSQDAVEREATYPAAGYVAPFLVLLLARMVSEALSTEFDVYYPLRVVLMVAILVGCMDAWWPLLGRVSWKFATSVGIAVYLLWILLVPGTGADGLSPYSQLSGIWASGWVIFRILGAVLIVPLTEELAFRGYLLRRLVSQDFTRVPVGVFTPTALILSSLAFGVLHSDWMAGLLAGLAYAMAGSYRGRFSDCVAAHAVTNLCLAIHVLVLGQWSLWN